jgi:hypothetical protein
VIEICIGGVIFVLLIGGLGLPVVAGLRLSASERLSLGTAAGVLILYLFAWAVYWTQLPKAAYLTLPLVAVGMSTARRSDLRAMWTEPSARILGVCWVILSGWCLGWLALVRSYSGGEWVGDWLEHYHRTLFFLERLPLNTRFLNMYLLPARPPLANLVLTPLLELTRPSFAFYQVFLCLFSALTFFPAALLARRFRSSPSGDPAVILALLLMLSPLFVENATFSWTKLPATFFILFGLYFFLSSSRTLTITAATCLTLALLTHYSAAPYIIALLVICAWTHRSVAFQPSRWRTLVPAICASTALAATWFGWSAWHYGPATVSSNTAVVNADGLNGSQQIFRRFENVYTLLVPHPLRTADYSPLVQDSAIGWIRDYIFNLYQTNLLMAFGTGGLIALAILVSRHWGEAREFWSWFLLIVLALHIAVIPWSDRWGSVQIALQPVILLGLAWIAASVWHFGNGIRICLSIGLLLDLGAGIVLQFVVQHIDLSNVYPDFKSENSIHFFGFPTWSNYLSKAAWHLQFLGDKSIPVVPLGFVLTLLLFLGIYWSVRELRNRIRL